jgi:hypothetical protein
MKTATDEVVVRVDDTPDDGVTHYFCCSPDTGLCGTQLNGEFLPPDDEDDAECVVCQDLQDQGAPCSARCPYGVSST